jgi:hypothetical protein
MPKLLREIDALFLFEKLLPYNTACNLRLEALASNTGIITDEAECTSGGPREVITVPTSNPASAASMICDWLTHRSSDVKMEFIDSFDNYIKKNEQVYQLVMSASLSWRKARRS